MKLPSPTVLAAAAVLAVSPIHPGVLNAQAPAPIVSQKLPSSFILADNRFSAEDAKAARLEKEAKLKAVKDAAEATDVLAEAAELARKGEELDREISRLKEQISRKQASPPRPSC